jgi:signal transduction histidine kinase/ActR/RegA family two-component response regulator
MRNNNDGSNTASLAAALGHQIFESSPDCVKLLDVDGHIIAMNQHGRCVMEIDDFNSIAGTSLKSLWPEKITLMSTLRLLLPDMEKQAISVDITERKRDEENLRQLAADLSESDRRKTEFLATLAHELRNPLAPIRSGLAVMHLSADNANTVAKIREMMDRQVTQMVRLVDDLLDVARISGGKIDLKKELVELKQILSTAVETSLPLIEANQHELTVNIPEEALLVEVDTTRICQVISNLLNNAAKYTPAGGRIALSAYQEDGFAVICVSDTGIGIPEESLPMVFEMFNQVGQNMDRAQGGLGIGLSLVRRLIEMHSGSVAATSAGSGKGSTFIVRLPLASADVTNSVAVARPSPSSSNEADKGIKVLVVDDNVDAATTLAMLLDVSGHTTQVAHDGINGLKAAQEFRPQVAFLDIGMPGMNGYETAEAIRKTPGLEHVVLVALTGWGAESDRLRAKDVGFHHHLTKPVSLAAVHALLSEINGPFATPPHNLHIVR